MPDAAPVRDRIRVLVVTTALSPDHLQVWQAASELPDVDLHLVGALVDDVNESYMAPLAVPEWGTVHVRRPTGMVGRGRLWWNLDGLEDLIASLRPDVVHVHSEVWGRLVGQALAGGAPVMAHGAENVSLVHGGRAEARIRRAVARRNARRLAGYASWNRAGVDLLRAEGLPAGAPTVVAPAIVPDPEPFLAVERSEDATGPVRVGYIGRLVPEKGVDQLIDAADGLPGLTLAIVGSGPYERELRNLAARREVTVDWRGDVSPAEVPKAYAEMDVVVVPSVTRPGWAEQFGRVVCEGMLTGAAVVSSDSGSLPEVVGDGGIVVPELDRAALHAALARLVDDPVERRRLGATGRRWALDNLVPAVAARRIAHGWHEVAAR